MAVTTPARTRVAARVGVLPAAIRTPRSGAALLVCLVAVCAYAAFAHGAVGLPEEPRLQIAIVLVGVLAAAGLLVTRTLALRAPAAAWIGVALLVAFAVWCGATLLWSVTPERTWAHVNRALSYALVVVLAIALASSLPRALERLACGWLLVALACALYALAGKVAPGVELLGIDVNHTSVASRLRAPLGYWNALALVMVLAIPIALRMTTDVTRRPATRVAAIVALYLLVVVLGMTYSRGGILSVVAALVVLTALGGPRLRGLAVVAVTLVAAIPVLGLAFSRPALKGINVPLDERVPDGILLGLVGAGSIIALLIGAWGLLVLERRIAWSAERTQLVWRGLGATAAILGVLMLGAIATAEGGPRGWADDAWEKFTQTTKDEVSDPSRIVSSNSGNRWVWWKEAAGAWSDRPLQGWGAGSFTVTHRLYREVELGAQHPHDMPLQFLAETGVVGALLVSGALGLLLLASARRIRAMTPGRERDLAVALVAGVVAWVVHGLVDWDWDIPGVTVPTLAFLGVLAASPYTPRSVAGFGDRAVGVRATALALACAVAGLLIVSAALPLIADDKASSAQVVSADADDAELRHAAAQAQLAARLDPTAVRPLLAAAAIAEGRGRRLDARGHLLDAVERQPYSLVAWQRLLQLAIETADRPGAQAAARRMLALDPLGRATLAPVGQLALFDVPAAGSPTATGTPLSPRYSVPASPGPAPVVGPASGLPVVPPPPAPAG